MKVLDFNAGFGDTMRHSSKNEPHTSQTVTAALHTTKPTHFRCYHSFLLSQNFNSALLSVITKKKNPPPPKNSSKKDYKKRSKIMYLGWQTIKKNFFNFSQNFLI